MELGKVKTKRVIKIIGVYQLFSALLCVFYLLVLVITQDLNTLGALLSIIIPSLLVAITIYNSINTVVSKSQALLSRESTINGIILALQSVTVFTEGFYYRYTQGNNLFFFVSLEHSTNEVLWDIYLQLAVLDFDLKFASSDYTLIGLNLLALVLAVVSFWAAGILKDNVAEPN